MAAMKSLDEVKSQVLNEKKLGFPWRRTKGFLDSSSAAMTVGGHFFNKITNF